MQAHPVRERPDAGDPVRRRTSGPTRYKNFRSLTVGVAFLVAVSIFPLSPAQASTAGTLSVDRTSAVAGWQLTFQGSTPTTGKQQVSLQRYLNGSWHDITSATTDATGAFVVYADQMAMPTEHYRARGAGFVTPEVTVKGIDQNVAISASTNSPASGKSFTLYADVTPQQSGRTVRFYRANSTGGWDLLGTTTTDASGHASAQVTGTGRYKALAAVYQGACAYPSLVLTLPAASLITKNLSDPASATTLSPQPSSNYKSAEHTYSWWPSGENWDWETGQGTAHWAVQQGGSGDVSIFVGMLAILSGSYNSSIPSYGTTVARLANKGHRYGRWEMRTKQKEFGTSFTPYTIQLRLVRRGSKYRVKPANVITIAQWRGYSGRTHHRVTRRGVTYGYSSGGTARNNTNFHNYAVELTRKHLTWLIDGKVIATAPARMIPGGYWVPQLVLKSRSGRRMTATRLATDWIRYFPLSSKTAKRLPTGPTPTRGG